MKKRVMLTLTAETVDEFQTVAKTLGLAPGTMSKICDEAILRTLEIFKKALSKGSFTMTDLFTMIGEDMEALHKEGTYSEKHEQHEDEKSNQTKPLANRKIKKR